jgi:hypothetical protein
MRIRIHVDYEVPPRVKRAVLIGVPAAIMLASSVGWATVPNVFKDGDPLTAQAINDNFTALDTHASALEARLTKLESANIKETADGGFSLGATYCGQTAQTTPGDLSGLNFTGSSYAKVRTACQFTCSSNTAHMCSGPEIEKTVQLGRTMGQGWFSPGVYNSVNGDDFECSGWTTAANGPDGDYWQGSPSAATCNNSFPVLCCD